ncbi:hypothetical protein BDV06DRAFT_159869 [Aspergillus oleicola]
MSGAFGGWLGFRGGWQTLHKPTVFRSQPRQLLSSVPKFFILLTFEFFISLSSPLPEPQSALLGMYLDCCK